MKKLIIVLGLCSLAASGCSKDNAQNDLYPESGNTINVNDDRTELYNEAEGKTLDNKSENFGYVRHQKDPIMGGKADNKHYTALDREQLANTISRLSTNIPDVNDVATLVTDEEVLIAYDSDTENRNLTADQVKRTAMSVVPRFFHVYVSDNKVLIKDVESLANLDSDSRNAESSIAAVVAEMKKSPQGKRINQSENKNGETMNGE